MYILKCVDGSYYTGSTNDLDRRVWEHQNQRVANYTKKRLPVKLVYFEEYNRIDEAFYREKQVQGWSRKKKEALVNGEEYLLPKLVKKVFRTESVASIRLPPSSSITQPPRKALTVVECPERSEGCI